MNQSILKVCYVFALLTSLISCGPQGPAGPAGAPAVQGLATGTYVQCSSDSSGITMTLAITNDTGHPLSYYPQGSKALGNTGISCTASSFNRVSVIYFSACDGSTLTLNGAVVPCEPLSLVTFMPGISYISETPNGLYENCPSSPGFVSCAAILLTDQNILTEINLYQSF